MFKPTVILSMIVIVLIGCIVPMPAEAKSALAENIEVVPESLGAEGISAESWAAMQAQMAAAQYHFTWQADKAGVESYRAPNPVLGLGVGFGPAGMQVWPLADSRENFRILLSAPAGEPVAAGDFNAAKGQVTHQANGMKETLENDEDGIHYILTMTETAQAETLNLLYQVSGSLVPHLNGDDLLVLDTDGKSVLNMGGLTAVDDAGQSYPAAFALEGGALTVEVRDLKNAALPLTIQMRIWTEGVKLTASEAQTGDLFGHSVAVSGDVIVVGASSSGPSSGTNTGAAYVFQRLEGGTDVWGEVTKLTASNAAADDWFGISVGVSGDVIVVGALLESNWTGAAYVFQRMQGGADAWGEVAKLTASDAAAGDQFGKRVAVSGDVVVVGATNEDDSGSNAGAAYVFQRLEGGMDIWGEVTKLTASDAAADDHFGDSVAVSGDVIVVGAGGKSNNTGSAYVFQRMQGGADAWGEVAKLTASDAAAGDYFGYSVAVSGDVVVAGASSEDDSGSNAGAAYVFQRMQDGTDAWGEVAKLTASDAQTEDRFGYAVAVSGDVIVVGAGGKSNTTGAAYVFHRLQGGSDSWGEVQKLTASDAAEYDQFGGSVAVSGDVIVVGAYWKDAGSTDVGAAYVFQDDAESWHETAKNKASDAANYNEVGNSVSVSGDVIVIGAHREGVNWTGAVYVFQRMQDGADAWGEVTKLTALDAAEWDSFGISVGVSGDVIVVGAHGDDEVGNVAGAAYVFQRMEGGTDTWGEVAKLTASDGAEGDQFGRTVAVSGDVIVVGAYSKDAGYDERVGAAYVFQRMQGGTDAWGEVAKLTASDAAEYDEFGQEVAVSGDVIVIGVPDKKDGDVDGVGAAYVFQRMQDGADAWGEVAKLTASDAAEWDLFGDSVAVSGDVIVVGAFNKDEVQDIIEAVGAVYVFQRMKGSPDNWGQVQKLMASDAAADDQFGNSVAVSGDAIVVGAGGKSNNTGGAYVFHRTHLGLDAWSEVDKLTASNPSPIDFFGSSVAISGDVIVISAPGEDTGGVDTGAAYIFQPDLPYADLSLSKTDSPDPVTIGGNLTYTLTVNSAGAYTAENLTVMDILPGSVTFQSAAGNGWTCGEAGGVVTCTRSTLAVGDAPDITITVTAPLTSGQISNSASVASDTYDPDGLNNTDDSQTTVQEAADLSLSKTDSPDPVNVGGTLTYTLAVSNSGPSTAENLTVTDTLSGGVTFQNASGDGWTCGEASGVVTCTRATLAVGDAPDITINVTAPSTAGDITNTAHVTSETFDPDDTNNDDDEITTVILWETFIPFVIR